ncbi:MAG: DUF2267 domain-containing protein [Armatimonadota bacterium]
MEYARLHPFQATLQKSDQWMKDTMEALGPDDPQKAYHALRAVLHALRDRLMPGEVADMAAQMPMLIRGLFLEGWRPTHKPSGEGDTVEEFLTAVNEQLQVPADVGPEDSVKAVFAVLTKRISGGELEDVRAMLPQSLQGLWPEASD